MNHEQPRTTESAMPIPWREATGAGTSEWPAASATAETLRERIRREVAAALAACGAFEWVALGYLAVSFGLMVSFHGNLAHPFILMGVQAGLAAAVLTLSRAQVRSAGKALLRGRPRGSRVVHFWRHWYTHLFFLFCFEELGFLAHLVYPGWMDAKLIAFDYWLTGVHPVIWLERFARPGLNDFMQFAYITYFLHLIVLGGVLYARKDWEAYWAVMTYSMAGYSIGYLIALFLPIESPWFAMAGAWRADLHGGFFTNLIGFIEHYGRVRGAAFPSEHVAGSISALWGAWRHRRWLFWVFLPLVICMCASTVYGRYHYVADVLAGMITGTLGYWVGAKLMRLRGSVPSSSAY